ncbi:beta-ketoacyl synthase N-terminal-like domain-containing protein [Streptomyces sp. NPDC017991]|uniref:beta-ketoacyl synthase N-terminal-like domain-containing protein n=1 Tax=Streptomyces sp. NPDC017991 TaxID=3365026 RepID=UPI0037BD2F32
MPPAAAILAGAGRLCALTTPDPWWLSPGPRTELETVAAVPVMGLLEAVGDVYAYEPEFFGINAKDSTWVDPEHRLLSEVVWEAIEHAGIPAQRSSDTPGMFFGICQKDYMLRVQRPEASGRCERLRAVPAPVGTAWERMRRVPRSVRRDCLHAAVPPPDRGTAGGQAGPISPSFTAS